MLFTYPTHLFNLDFVTLIIFYGSYKFEARHYADFPSLLPLRFRYFPLHLKNRVKELTDGTTNPA
jgi:hypothetical protein